MKTEKLSQWFKEKIQDPAKAAFSDKSNYPLIILAGMALAVMLLSMLTGILFPQTNSKGKALEPGDCIGVAAPAFFIKDNAFQESVDILEEAGYRVKLAPSCTSAEGYLAGSDEVRAQDINDLFADDEVDAIVCLRGGYGSSRILDLLDYSMIKRHPKLFVGFSDVTALHTALLQECGLSTVYGPMISSLSSGTTDYTMSQMMDGLSGKAAVGEITLPEDAELTTLAPGTAEGVIVGGNLTVLASMVGTEYELKGDGALLLLEEVGEPPYKVDRMMRQLYENGLFDRVNGILIGEFYACEDERGRALSDVLEEYAALSGKPVIMGIPSGHDVNNMFLPFGVKAVMTGREDGTASLVIEESVYR